MSDLIDPGGNGNNAGNAPEFSVSELSGVVKRMIEGEFSHVRVRGELGRVSRPASGHVYLDLKDDRAVLSGVIWKGVAARLAHRPEEGMEVIATGRLTTFPGQSRYQIVIEALEPAGIGALMAMLEKRRKALAAEGLFDPARKKTLPYLPAVIGVITSPSGAVIRDILHRLRERFPRKVLLWPVTVQGAGSAPEIARAIKGFNALDPDGTIPRPDLLIVARGGGSVEDLWGFNEEIVVRAAAQSDIPLISAVGHETDTTLIDHASDLRAPTPTAAAELAVPVLSELRIQIASLHERRLRGWSGGLETRRQRLRDLSRALPRPGDLLASERQSLDNLAARLGPGLKAATQGKRVVLAARSAILRPSLLARMTEQKRKHLGQVASRFSQAVRSGTERQRARLDALDRMRLTLGYRQTLARGFAVVRGADNAVITRSKPASSAPSLEIEFHDGRVKATPAKAARTARKPSSKPPRGNQGSLF